MDSYRFSIMFFFKMVIVDWLHIVVRLQDTKLKIHFQILKDLIAR